MAVYEESLGGDMGRIAQYSGNLEINYCTAPNLIGILGLDGRCYYGR